MQGTEPNKPHPSDVSTNVWIEIQEETLENESLVPAAYINQLIFMRHEEMTDPVAQPAANLTESGQSEVSY